MVLVYYRDHVRAHSVGRAHLELLLASSNT